MFDTQNHFDHWIADSLEHFREEPSPLLKSRIKKRLRIINFLYYKQKLIYIFIAAITLSTSALYFSFNYSATKSVSQNNIFEFKNYEHRSKNNTQYTKIDSNENIDSTNNSEQNMTKKLSTHKKIIKQTTNISLRNTSNNYAKNNDNFASNIDRKNSIEKIENNKNNANVLNKKINLLPRNTSLITEYNTSSINPREKNKLKDSWHSFEIYWNFGTNKYKNIVINKEANSQFKDYVNASKPTTSIQSYGALFNFYQKNLSLGIGIEYNKYNENFVYDLLVRNPKSVFSLIPNGNPYTYSQNNLYYLVDTTNQYYHYTYIQDSTIHVADSVWVVETQTIPVNTFDTLKSFKYDTIQHKKYSNAYSYLEIPMSIGYQISKGKFKVILKSTISPARLIFANGSNIVPQENIIERPINYTIPFRRYLLYGAVSANFSYFISEKIGFYVEPYYKTNLTNILNNKYFIKKQLNTNGLKIGLTYFF